MAKLHAWQMQVAAILCNMLLCALPNNDVSFAELLISNQGFQIAKVCSFLNYFRRISQVSFAHYFTNYFTHYFMRPYYSYLLTTCDARR